jgi:hypothetical protein
MGFRDHALSIIGLLGMGGFLIGTVLGVIGGAQALGWSPSNSRKKITDGQ